MVMLNSVEKAIVGICNQSNFDVFDQRKRALLHKLEVRPKSGWFGVVTCGLVWLVVVWCG